MIYVDRDSKHARIARIVMHAAAANVFAMALLLIFAPAGLVAYFFLVRMVVREVRAERRRAHLHVATNTLAPMRRYAR